MGDGRRLGRQPRPYAGLGPSMGRRRAAPAIAVFVPIVAIALPQVGQWPEPKLPSDDPLAADGSHGRVGGVIRFSFTIPHGQVAVLELVTRRNGVTTPIPNLAAYALAPADRGSAAVFRFRPDRPDQGAVLRVNPG